MAQDIAIYCQSLQAKADKITQNGEGAMRFNHLQAFNFGRSVARLEHARHAFWLRVRWLLMGAAVGVTFAALYFHVFASGRVLHLAK